MKNIIKAFFFCVLAVSLSCTGDFEEINTNPNSPETAPSSAILTWVQRATAEFFGDVWYNYNESSSMAGHITKIAYIDEARYAFRAGTVDNMFNNAYTRIRNINRILLNEEGEDGNPNMAAIALILKCYIYHITTDHLKDIPYTDAFKAEEGILAPKYDSQESIYRDLLEVLKTASNMIDENPPAYNRITGADFFYGGNMTRWKRLANSLRLRLAVRISYVDEAGARAVISEILGNPSVYPLLESNDDIARFKFPGDANYREQLSASQLTRMDYVACANVVRVLSELNDPRLPVFVQKTEEGGIYSGYIAGAHSVGNQARVSKVGTFFSENVAGYTYFFRYAEVEFLKAEIFERGLFAGNAEAAYNAGIRASMAEYAALPAPHPSIAAALVDPYLALPKVAYTNAELPRLTFAGNDFYEEEIPAGDLINIRYIPDNIVLDECANPTVKGNIKLQKIAYQKWISLFQQGQEAWAEVRRTDIPVISAAPARPATYVNHNRAPFRYPYSFLEESVNGDNVKAVSNGIVDFYWGQQMWWDIRTGVR